MTEQTIHLGVVGHRLNKLSSGDLTRLRHPVGSVLAILKTSITDDRQLTVLTSLAEGADRLVTEEAMARHIPVDVVLPYSVERFGGDFPEQDSKNHYQLLLSKAHSITMPEHDESPTQAGYHWASEVIVDKADVLLAIWDGEPGNGPGGTAWTIDSALTAAIPVIWVLSRSPWSIDVVEPDGGLNDHPFDRHLAHFSSSLKGESAAQPPLSRKTLHLL